MSKTDPYAALRIKEFNLFLLVRFALIFGWSMQFIIIEWKVYELTGDPLYLGLIGLMEIIPALSMALFALRQHQYYLVYFLRQYVVTN